MNKIHTCEMCGVVLGEEVALDKDNPSELWVVRACPHHDLEDVL